MTARPEQVRIGDAERERAQSALADHYVAGRLDHDEYSQRLDRIWAARTAADLAPVFVDLPRGQGVARPTPYSSSAERTRRGVAAPARRRGGMPGPVLVLLLLLMVPAAFVVTANLPLILLGVAAWFLLVRGGCRSPRRRW